MARDPDPLGAHPVIELGDQRRDVGVPPRHAIRRRSAVVVALDREYGPFTYQHRYQQKMVLNEGDSSGCANRRGRHAARPRERPAGPGESKLHQAIGSGPRRPVTVVTMLSHESGRLSPLQATWRSGRSSTKFRAATKRTAGSSNLSTSNGTPNAVMARFIGAVSTSPKARRVYPLPRASWSARPSFSRTCGNREPGLALGM